MELTQGFTSRLVSYVVLCRDDKHADRCEGTKEKADNTIAAARQEFPSSTGYLEYLYLDLANLPTVKECAEQFLSKESRLDVLVNNAGVGQAPQGMKSAQGYEIQMAINCLGAFVFTELLRKQMEHTVQMNSIRKGSVRVCWLGSSLAEMQAPEGGIDMPNITSGKFEGHTSSFCKFVLTCGCTARFMHRQSRAC